MLLPSLAARAALKLNNPAQRFAWAADQLVGGSQMSPAIAANPARNIPAKAANAGLLPPYNDKSLQGFAESYFSRDPGVNQLMYYLALPYSEAQLVRGVPLLKCIQPIISGATNTYVGGVPTGDVAVDSSVATTVEEYCFEQFLLAQPSGNYGNQWSMSIEKWYTSERAYFYDRFVIIKATVPLLQGNNAYSGITGLIERVV